MPLRRVTELGSLLARLGPDAVPAVTAVFDAAPMNRGDVELALFGSWWAGLDPEAAWQWTKTDWRAEHTVVMAAIARSWAHCDPKAALGPRAAAVPRPGADHRRRGDGGLGRGGAPGPARVCARGIPIRSPSRDWERRSRSERC